MSRLFPGSLGPSDVMFEFAVSFWYTSSDVEVGFPSPLPYLLVLGNVGSIIGKTSPICVFFRGGSFEVLFCVSRGYVGQSDT
jgi:hypothetical protein